MREKGAKSIHGKDHEDSCSRPSADLPTVGEDAGFLQSQSLKAFLRLFLRAQGVPLPEHSSLKSANPESISHRVNWVGAPDDSPNRHGCVRWSYLDGVKAAHLAD